MLKQPATEDLVGAPLRTPIIHRLYQDLIQPFIGKWQAFWHTPPLRMASPHCRILLTAGVNRLGQNIGDDAQLARTLHCWKQVAPDAKLNVMTLDPEGLARLHPSVQAVPAPRKAFFSAHRFYSGYGSGRLLFRIRFAFIAPWLGLNARLWRAGLPILGLSADTIQVLHELRRADLLFLYGGGILTGATHSRLWENMIVLRLARLFGTPAILSGQTIGPFNDFLDRAIAHWGLSTAQAIYTRDPVFSAKELRGIGIPDFRIFSHFDDALFHESAPQEVISATLKATGLDPSKPYLTVNAHAWGMGKRENLRILRGLGKILNEVQNKLGLQILFIGMAEGDEESLLAVAMETHGATYLISHHHPVSTIAGVIRGGSLCLTMRHHPIIFAMGGGVPTLALCYHPYFRHKNLGAMSLFQQERYVVSTRDSDFPELAVGLLMEVWERREAITATTNHILQALRPMEGTAIHTWLIQQSGGTPQGVRMIDT